MTYIGTLSIIIIACSNASVSLLCRKKNKNSLIFAFHYAAVWIYTFPFRQTVKYVTLNIGTSKLTKKYHRQNRVKCNLMNIGSYWFKMDKNVTVISKIHFISAKLQTTWLSSVSWHIKNHSPLNHKKKPIWWFMWRMQKNISSRTFSWEQKPITNSGKT